MPQTTTTHGFCRAEQTTTRWSFAGFATATAGENAIRPRAFFQSCTSCHSTFLTLGGHRDVPDALGLCQSVQADYNRRTGRANRDHYANYDEDNVLGDLYEYVWALYNRWRPTLLTFRSFATWCLRHKVNTFVARDTGDAAGRRKLPKAHARSVSVSYEALTTNDAGAYTTGERDFQLGFVTDGTPAPLFSLNDLSSGSQSALVDIVLRQEAGMSLQEIADTLHLNRRVVHSRLHMLRRELQARRETASEAPTNHLR